MGSSVENVEKTEKRSVGLTNILVIVMSLIFVGMSALVIFVEGVETVFLCYAICVAAIIVGIYMIVHYFMTDAYRNVNAYGFSIGTLLVILGICGLLRAEQMAGAFIVILGIILLLSGIIVLQHSMDLRRMEDVIWIPALIVSALILICGIMAIIKPFEEKIDYSKYVWWMIMISGGLGILINLYTMIRVALFKKKETKLAAKAEAEKEAAKADNTESVEKVGVDNTQVISSEEKGSMYEASDKTERIETDVNTKADSELDSFYEDGITDEE